MIRQAGQVGAAAAGPAMTASRILRMRDIMAVLGESERQTRRELADLAANYGLVKLPQREWKTTYGALVAALRRKYGAS